MRPTLKHVVLAAVGLVALYFAVGWIIDSFRTDESRIRLMFMEVSEYARNRDSGGVLEYLDPEYHDPQGFSAAEVRRIVFGYFRNAESVEADFEPIGIEGIEVEGDETDVLVRARLVLHMSGDDTVTLASGGIRGEYLIIRLRRHESYFRAKSARPAEPEEVPE